MTGPGSWSALNAGIAARILAILLLISINMPGQARAEELPLWEAGLGLAPLSFPDYRGSGRQRQYVLPLPYVVYRGDFLQVDRGGMRGLLLDTRRLELDFSIGGVVPVRSSDDGPRTGMPDLDPMLEAGVSLSWMLAHTRLGKIRLRLPLRAGIAVSLDSFGHQGWKAEPQLHFESTESRDRWNVSLATGPVFADRRYHSYYYRVSPEFATPERPAYEARGGYSGWSFVASTSRRFQNTWIGAFLRYDNLDGSRFRDSPLVETHSAVMGGLGIAWVIKTSSRRVSPTF